ncbi:MAG: hypothetical protein ABI581_07830 [Sediminibacterium sp.]
MANTNHIFESLFKTKQSSEDVQVFLEQVATEHPYFSPTHFFLMQQMQPGTEAYKLQAAKTSILFNNAYWLNFQLLENGDDLAQQRNIELLNDTPEKVDDFLITEIKDTDEEHQENSQPIEPIATDVSTEESADLPVESITKNRDDNTFESLVSEFGNTAGADILAGENTAPLPLTEDTGENVETELKSEVENSGKDIQEDPVSAMPDEEDDKATVEDDLESSPHEPASEIEEPVAEDTKQGSKTEIIETNEQSNETEAATVNELVVPAVEENEVSKIDGLEIKAPEPADSEPMSEEELPLTEDDIDPMDNKPLNFKLNIETPSSTEKELTFEPLHTTDYFASLGIKLSGEIKPGDKLGKQLKSFTEWLKTMKKVHTDKLEQSSGGADQVIQSLAEKSNTEDEVLTETMAEVLIQQGKADKAIEVYKKLSLLNPSKNAYFAAKIDQLKQ